MVDKIKISALDQRRSGNALQEELVIRMELPPNVVVLYSGLPENVNKKITWPGPDGTGVGGFRWASGFYCECPAEIVAQYAELYKKHPELRGPVPGKEVASGSTDKFAVGQWLKEKFQ